MERKPQKTMQNGTGSSLPPTIGHPNGSSRHLGKRKMGQRSLPRTVGSPYRPRSKQWIFELHGRNSRDELGHGSGEKGMDTNEAMEARLAKILEQGVEKMAVAPQFIHYKQAMFQDDWQGYNTYPNQYSSSWMN
ncbi:hypothetical protein M9H77_29626 [Catharanthus roseus]|uniref:Uncharacterized protein n=1 Tax=Catharanthus roseus TaxID=4058 RepID=A0ACB9ZWW9_CATRO|nr:hypothetical protein M9H77_29626 [Catharanthus roseus]